MAIQLATTRYKFPGARETDVREQLGWSPTIFCVRVNALLDYPAALAAYPMDVHRLRRLRVQRRRPRAS